MNATVAADSIRGMQVFLVEDETLVSLLIESMLDDLGCVVAGTADSVGQALDQLSHAPGIEAAILDVHLGGETVFPVADALMRRGVPFVFSTGYGPADLAERYPGSPLLAKPYLPDALAGVLARLRKRSPRAAP